MAKKHRKHCLTLIQRRLFLKANTVIFSPLFSWKTAGKAGGGGGGGGGVCMCVGWQSPSLNAN